MSELIFSVAAAGLLVVFASRAAILERGRPLVALAALTPYAVPVGVVLTVVAASVAGWGPAVAPAVPTVLIAAVLMPRCVPSRRAVSSGAVPVRVLTSNLLRGQADADALVALVRDRRVDVLCVQELTIDGVDALKQAGLTDELPHVFFDAVLGELGDTGLASRHHADPVAVARRDVPGEGGDAGSAGHPYADSVAAVRGIVVGDAGSASRDHADPVAAVDGFVTGARVRLPGSVAVEVFSVHPIWPMGPDGSRPWRAALGALPLPDPAVPPRIVAGDFNATLDHASMRRVLAAGYRDAAVSAGAGLRPTWPGAVRSPWPPVTIDHVLAGPGSVVQSYEVITLPGTDHRAVLVEILLPE